MPRTDSGRALVTSRTRRRVIAELWPHQANSLVAILQWRLRELGRATANIGNPCYLGLSVGGIVTPGPVQQAGSRSSGRPFLMTTGDVHAVNPHNALGTESAPRPRFSGYAVSQGGTDRNEDQTGEEHAQIWQIVELAQNGNAEAFGLLYDRYADMVFRFIYYRVHDRQLAEDFTSETFLRALRRITTVTYQGRDIGAWFMTIARNIVLDHVKSARNRLEFTTGDIIEDGRSEPSTETAVLSMLSNERLIAAVNTLNEEQKECVVLRFIQGLSVAETASVMGKKEGAIKALQHRAIKKLAGDIKDELK